MPDYQWAVGKGKIITADYDRSMALNADQVEGEVRKAFSNLFDGVVVEPICSLSRTILKEAIIRNARLYIRLPKKEKLIGVGQ